MQTYTFKIKGVDERNAPAIQARLSAHFGGGTTIAAHFELISIGVPIDWSEEAAWNALMGIIGSWDIQLTPGLNAPKF